MPARNPGDGRSDNGRWNWSEEEQTYSVHVLTVPRLASDFHPLRTLGSLHVTWSIVALAKPRNVVVVLFSPPRRRFFKDNDIFIRAADVLG